MIIDPSVARCRGEKEEKEGKKNGVGGEEEILL